MVLFHPIEPCVFLSTEHIHDGVLVIHLFYQALCIHPFSVRTEIIRGIQLPRRAVDTEIVYIIVPDNDRVAPEGKMGINQICI